MPCYRCSTPTATPLVASGRDWGSCGSVWGRPAPLTAWPRSPWSWRGEADAFSRTRALARGDLALSRSGMGARSRRSSERPARDLRAVAQSHTSAAVPPAGRGRGPPDQPPSRRRLPGRALGALGVSCGARLLATRRRGRSARAGALSAPGRGSRPHARRSAWAGRADEARCAGRGAARGRGGDCRGRSSFLGVVDRVVGSVLPAPAVRSGGDQVQRAVRGGARKGGAASRDDYGRAGAAGRDVRRGPVTAARLISWLWGQSTAARLTRAQGAHVLVLDDAFQLLGVGRDLNIAVVSAESAAASPWPLPAGPWREGRDALRRADLIVVTRKTASAEAAAALAERLGRAGRTPLCLASLVVSHLEGMRSGGRQELAVLAGRRVVAAAGIADPASFAQQLKTAGANVQLVAYQEHHAYRPADLEPLVRAAARGDYVVVTEKDAVKLRRQWPGGAAEPLVAVLAVHWERNGRALEQAVDAVLAPAGRA